MIGRDIRGALNGFVLFIVSIIALNQAVFEHGFILAV